MALVDGRRRRMARNIGLGALLSSLLFVGSCWYNGFPLHPRYSMLVQAVGSSDAASVELILDSGFDPNVIPDDFWTRFTEMDSSPLALAAGNGDIRIATI